MPKFWDTLFGKSAQPSTEQFSRLTPDQQALQSSLVSGLGGPQQNALNLLNGLLQGDSAAYDAYAAPYMRQFYEQTIPSIAERFAGMDAQSSSAFRNALGGAGAGLQENLAAQAAQLQQNALGQLQGFYGPAFQQSFDTMYDPGSQMRGIGGDLLSAYLGAGAPGAGAATSKIGGAFKGMFGGNKSGATQNAGLGTDLGRTLFGNQPQYWA